MKVSSSALADTPTLDLWHHYQAAFDFLNQELFRDSLPRCILNFAARGRCLGVFKLGSWTNTQQEPIHEISLNPEILRDRPIEFILAILVRQMVTLWYYKTFNTLPTSGYCDASTAKKMEDIGLIPSHTGKPGGRMTGKNIKFYIDPRGKFALTIAAMPNGWFPYRGTEINTAPKPQTRITVSCPSCQGVAWIARGSALKLVCKADNAEMVEVEETAVLTM